MSALARYDAACRALAEARRVEDAKEAMDIAEAAREWARRVGDRSLEIDAAEVAIRARRRCGELLDELKAAGRLGRGRESNVLTSGHLPKVTLEEIGVSRNFSSECQQLAAMEPFAFEESVGRYRDRCAETGRRVTTALLREETRTEERAAFAARTADGCTVGDLHALAESGARFGAILADPPWEYRTRSEMGADRAASRHYLTQPLDDILKMPAAALAAPDCVLFLWTSGPFLPQALAVVDAWGFTYKTVGFDWGKTTEGGAPRGGTGYWTRACCEHVLLATRGAPRRLDAGVLQLILSPRLEHSRKPDAVQDGIERLVGGPYLELYARRLRPGWTSWGNEISPSEMRVFGALAERPVSQNALNATRWGPGIVDDIRRMVREAREPLLASDIAARFPGMNKGAVKGICRRNGIPLPDYATASRIVALRRRDAAEERGEDAPAEVSR